MLDRRELRLIRLKHEYEELMRLNGPVIEVIPLGSPPYEKYRVIFHIRTIVGPEPTYREQTVCTLTAPADYPKAPPRLSVDQPPCPWHVNWFRDGRWDIGHWDPMEPLASYLIRCARTLQFDPEMANPHSPSNRDAMAFWEANRDNRAVIPCDTQTLPTLESLIGRGRGSPS